MNIPCERRNPSSRDFFIAFLHLCKFRKVVIFDFCENLVKKDTCQK